MGRMLNLLGFAVGLAALVAQFPLTLQRGADAGMSVAGSVVLYFSYFTILSNILAVLTHFAHLGGRPAAFREPFWRGGMAVYMAVLTIVYYTLLSNVWEPQGLQLATDIAMHYAVPAIYWLWWAMYGADGTLHWGFAPRWLILPVAYLAYVALRAVLTGGIVPYPFLDVAQNGWPRVTVTVLVIAALFFVLGLIVVAIDRFIGRLRGQPQGGFSQ